MNHSPQWPILHILVGIPIVLAFSYLWGGAMKGWGLGDETVLTSATLVSVVGASYTFLSTFVERSYYMVFWAREKIKREFEQARQEARREGRDRGRAEGRAEGEGRVEINQEWHAWYKRMQAAQREGRTFDEPPPDIRNGEESS